VINEPVLRNGRPSAPRRITEFEIGVGVCESLRRLRAAGFLLFVVSNQPDVARGLLPPESLLAMTEKIMTTLAPDAVKVCPHDDRDRCGCRKPGTKMLLDLACEYDVALIESYIIGDSWKDTLAGNAAGCRSIILDRLYNREASADFRVADLNEAVDVILRGAENEQ
jgi:D-glycero-D-manno-heptose 1,7-bisphosphate phosphatase